MPPKYGRPGTVRPVRGAKHHAELFAVDSNAEDNPVRPRGQAQRRLDLLNERALWRSYKRAVALDEFERSSASRILRDLAYHAWRSEFLADEFAL